MDRQTEFSLLDRVCIPCSAVKILASCTRKGPPLYVVWGPRIVNPSLATAVVVEVVVVVIVVVIVVVPLAAVGVVIAAILAGVLSGYIQWELAGDKEFCDIKRSVT